MRTFAWLSALGLLAAACRPPRPTLDAAVLAQLRERQGTYLGGRLVDLKPLGVLNEKDFVYAVALSSRAGKAALTRLGPQFFHLGLFSIEPPAPLFDPRVNHYQYDVEGLAFSPDGSLVATAGRDGAVRLYAVDTGTEKASYLTEEPLVSLAFHPSGKYLVVGSARGLVTVLTSPGLRFSYEERAHSAEVRGIAVGGGGQVFTGGWDKAVVSFEPVEEKVRPGTARMRFERRGNSAVVRGVVNDKVSVAFAIDERVPQVVLSSEAAAAAGIDVPFLKETVNIPTALGTSVARLARKQTLMFKSLRAVDVDVAVCDPCLAKDTQGVLGAPFKERFELAFDEVASELVISSREQAGAEELESFLALKVRKRFAFDWFINDLTVDRLGHRLGVAFSHQKGERTREVYEREKRGDLEPPHEGNAGAIVDAQTGELLKKWNLHSGVVSTAAISPDGQTLVTGGWDKAVHIGHFQGRGAAAGGLRQEVLSEREIEPPLFGWSVRRVRFSEDGHHLAVGAWTPQNPLGDQKSDPAAVLYEVIYADAQVLSSER